MCSLGEKAARRAAIGDQGYQASVSNGCVCNSAHRRTTFDLIEVYENTVVESCTYHSCWKSRKRAARERMRVGEGEREGGTEGAIVVRRCGVG